MLNVYHSFAHLLCSCHFTFLCCINLRDCLSCNRVQVLQFPLPNMVITTGATPYHWAFYFKGSGLPLSFSQTWLGSINKAYITLEELQAAIRWLSYIWVIVLLMLIYEIKVVYYLFLWRLTCHIFILADKHGIALIPGYKSTHLNVEADHHEEGWFQNDILFLTKLKWQFDFGVNWG